MRFDYLKFGKGSRSMLILPGLSVKSVCGDSQAIIQAYQLFEDDFTVYLFDYPFDIEEGMSIVDLADAFIDKIDKLNIHDIYLYGVSLGGMIAQILINKRADLFKKLAIASSTSKQDGNKRLERWVKYAKNRDGEKLVESVLRDIYTDEFYNQYGDYIKQIHEYINEEEYQRFINLANIICYFDCDNSNTNIESFVLASKKDKIFNNNDFKLLVDALNSEYYLYEDYSHAIYDEAADIKQRIYDFYLKGE